MVICVPSDAMCVGHFSCATVTINVNMLILMASMHQVWSMLEEHYEVP